MAEKGWRVEVGAARLSEHYLVSPDNEWFLTGATQEVAPMLNRLKAQDARIAALEAQVAAFNGTAVARLHYVWDEIHKREAALERLVHYSASSSIGTSEDAFIQAFDVLEAQVAELTADLTDKAKAEQALAGLHNFVGSVEDRNALQEQLTAALERCGIYQHGWGAAAGNVQTLRAALQRIVDSEELFVGDYETKYGVRFGDPAGVPTNADIARDALKATEPGSVREGSKND